jgi:hypothetical protein
MLNTDRLKRKRNSATGVATCEFFEWQAMRGDESSSTISDFYKANCVSPMDARRSSKKIVVSRTQVYENVKKVSETIITDLSLKNLIPIVGRPTVLSVAQEKEVLEACGEFEHEFGILTKTVVAEEARHIAMKPLGEEVNDDILWGERAAARFNRVGGRRWISGFIRRHPDVTISKTKRPIEKQRAAKTQPEISVQHYRILAHAIALCQVQRAIAAGRNVAGWELSEEEGIVTRVNGGGRDPGYDVLRVIELPLELKAKIPKTYLEVIPLGEPLEPLDPKFMIALDEKPLAPDAPCSVVMSVKGVKHSIGSSRSSSWTVTPVIRAYGELIHTQIITRASSVSSYTSKLLAKDFTFGRTEKGMQTDASFVRFAEDWMPKVGATLACPGIVVLDGHISHLSRKFTRLALQNHLIVICEPSHMSILLQAGDNGVNAYVDKTYSREYTTTFAVKGGEVTVDDRIMCLFRTFEQLKTKKKLITHSFNAVALTGNIDDCIGHWKTAHFALGDKYRGPALPKVTGVLLAKIFCHYQLSLPWGTLIIFPNSIAKEIPEALRIEFQAWLLQANEGEKQMFGGSYSSYLLGRSAKGEGDMAVRLWGANFEVTLPTLEASSSRVNISIGRFLSGDSASNEADLSHEKSLATEENRKRLEKARDEKNVNEEPIRSFFIKLGTPDPKITRKVMIDFATLNPQLKWPVPFPFSAVRAEQVISFLAMVSENHQQQISANQPEN